MRHAGVGVVVGLMAMLSTSAVAVAVAAEPSGASDASPLMLRSHHSNDHAARRLLPHTNNSTAAALDPFLQLEIMRDFRAQVNEERNKRWKDRSRQQAEQERKEKAQRVYAKLSSSQPSQKEKLERVSPEQWQEIDAQQKQRGLSWFGGDSSASGNGNPYGSSVLADPGSYYDKWAQAYRMLGGFIDCDHSKSDNSHDNGNNNNNNNNGGGGACSRWMMWAAVCIYFIFLCGVNSFSFESYWLPSKANHYFLFQWPPASLFTNPRTLSHIWFSTSTPTIKGMSTTSILVIVPPAHSIVTTPIRTGFS